MIGAVIGDIVGSVYEFDPIKTKGFALFGPYRGNECCFTDDTVMTIAVARAIQTAKPDRSDLAERAVEQMRAIGRNYPDCGYGGRFKQWMFDDGMGPYNSFGNGSAMRVSAAAWAAQSMKDAVAISDLVTGVTHDHPEGMKGARAVTACIYLALHGRTKDEIRDYVRERFYPLVETLDEIRPTYAFNETCQESVPQAIECFLEADGFEDAIRNAVSLGGDADTLAAIAGSIAEAYFGVPAELRKKAEGYLDADLLGYLHEFEAAYPIVRKPKKGEKLEEAIRFAVDAHAGMKRKGKDRAYILHPVEAMAIAAGLTEDEDVIAAAVLHDTVEDADVTLREIEKKFGKRVALLVGAETENKREDRPAAETWELRKRETIERLATAAKDVKIVCFGDKLANLRELARDYARQGDTLWERFNQKDKSRHAWYYRSLGEIFRRTFGPTAGVREYTELIQSVFGS